MSIALRHITLAYGRRILLRDVSASVPPGSLTALIGRNGTGKSTLLRAGTKPERGGESRNFGRLQSGRRHADLYG